MILARESIFRLGYFSGFFIFVVIALTIMLYCTFIRMVNWDGSVSIVLISDCTTEVRLLLREGSFVFVIKSKPVV